jgi:hypothetical protein
VNAPPDPQRGPHTVSAAPARSTGPPPRRSARPQHHHDDAERERRPDRGDIDRRRRPLFQVNAQLPTFRPGMVIQNFSRPRLANFCRRTLARLGARNLKRRWPMQKGLCGLDDSGPVCRGRRHSSGYGHSPGQLHRHECPQGTKWHAKGERLEGLPREPPRSVCAHALPVRPGIAAELSVPAMHRSTCRSSGVSARQAARLSAFVLRR